MIKHLVVGAAAVAATLSFTPLASAEPNPSVPNGDGNWCPGGQHSSYGGIRECWGAPFPNGSVYVQTGSFGSGGPFGPWKWHTGANCKLIKNGESAFPGYGDPKPDCGGGPKSI